MQGENGDDFFMIEEGKLQALKQFKPGNKSHHDKIASFFIRK